MNPAKPNHLTVPVIQLQYAVPHSLAHIAKGSVKVVLIDLLIGFPSSSSSSTVSVPKGCERRLFVLDWGNERKIVRLQRNEGK